ncbi:MAG TPA: tetratricopeptide repeat protein, partial [Dokdonella sp.]
PTTAKLRMFYALAELRSGDVDSAAHELALAQAFWNGDRERFGDALARSRIVEGQIAKQRGDFDGAVRVYRAAVPEAVATLGADADDTINIENSLALVLMQTGELDEAEALMQHVLAAKEALGRTSDDAVTARQNLGAIAFSRGDYARAESLLRAALDARRDTYGPSAAMAAAELSLARTLIRSGRPDAAQDALAEAAQMALHFTGDHSPLTLAVDQAEAEAAIARGDAAAAAPLVERALKEDAAFGDKTPLYALTLALEARLRALQGRDDEARALLADAEGRLAALGSAGRTNLAYVRSLERVVAAAH